MRGKIPLLFRKFSMLGAGEARRLRAAFPELRLILCFT
jgi:hypothetical protein